MCRYKKSPMYNNLPRWQPTWSREELMMRGKLITFGIAACVSLGGLTTVAAVPQDGPVATFKSSIDLVRVAAVVRDRKGRFVQDLTARDFEVLEGNQTRPIADFRREVA